MNALQCSTSMNTHAPFAGLCGAAAVALSLAAFAAGQVPGSPLAIRSIAEVESRTFVAGQEDVKLIPADRVVPGGRVIYTLVMRNNGPPSPDAPHITQPLPQPTPCVAGST